MGDLKIDLSEAAHERLQVNSASCGLTPEEAARRALEAWLDEPAQDLVAAAEYVLSKNAELYRRLA